MKKFILAILAIAALTVSCREPIVPSPTPGEEVGGSESGAIAGFFLINEGNMGSNKCTLDYYDYASGIYSKNIFPQRNPSVALSLGDGGNDVEIYGGKLYAVVNRSNIVEVMDVATARHIGQIDIPNCRYIAFEGGNAYVSSYAGPFGVDPTSRLGYVAKVDTTTLRVVDTCTVGYQPEEMVVVGRKLYVANSGGYRYPDYDNTVSVINLDSFKESKKIEVAINLHRMEKDIHGNVWVSSRGDYYTIPSRTYVIDSATDRVMHEIQIPVADMAICGDSLYVYSSEWNYATQSSDVAYAIVNTSNFSVVSNNFITDGTDASIISPYGLAVNPSNREILLTDAGDYVTPGIVYCFSPDGKKKWSATTGDIPSHMVFTTKHLE